MSFLVLSQFPFQTMNNEVIMTSNVFLNGTEGHDFNSVMRKFDYVAEEATSHMGNMERMNFEIDVRKSQASAISNDMVSTTPVNFIPKISNLKSDKARLKGL